MNADIVSVALINNRLSAGIGIPVIIYLVYVIGCHVRVYLVNSLLFSIQTLRILCLLSLTEALANRQQKLGPN